MLVWIKQGQAGDQSQRNGLGVTHREQREQCERETVCLVLKGEPFFMQMNCYPVGMWTTTDRSSDFRKKQQFGVFKCVVSQNLSVGNRFKNLYI